MTKSLARSISALLAFCFVCLGASAQTLFTEGFENETPFDADNLCSPGNEYTPADENWALGPACAVPTNGIPQLIELGGDTHLLYNNQYGADSEVFNSAAVDISDESEVVISFDARSQGDLESGGNFLDEFDVYVVMDGVESNIFSVDAHVDGTSKGGDDAVRTYAYSEPFAATGDEMFIRVKVKISGAGGQEQYALSNLSICVDSNGDGDCSSCDDPLEFDPPLDSPTVVECLDELPTECDATQGATRGVVSCGLSSDVQSRTVCTATTAMGTGPDGAIALFDIDGDGADDRFFVPTGAGLTLTQFENGVAIVSGQVEDVDDPTAILDVNIFYDNGVSGADWTGGYKTDMSCMIPVTGNATTDEWSIYLLNSGLSFLTGSGSLDGTTLQLTHSPSTEYFGFQVGESANDRNCNYGAGGWFAYEGFLNGSAIQGGTGDVLLDLECSEEINNDCGDQESTVTLYYAAFDADCGDVIQGSETYSREDTEGPEFVNPPQDMEVACTDWYLAVPTVTVTDNCEDSDAVAPTVTFEEDTIAQTGSGCLTVVRSWTAEDCSGNQTGHQQVITVVDNNGPTITGGADYEAQCDGDGNPDELSMWLSSNGGASATDDCGTVSWGHDYTDGDLSDECGATGTVDVTFTAADDCGNESDITLTFTIVDVTAPTLNVTSAVDVACETYSATGIYGATATDICGDATVELVSVTDVSSGCPQYLHVYKAVDDCGNESATIDQVVSLVDEEDPVVNITCPANYAAYLDGDCLTDISPAAAGTATATGTDYCSTPAPTATYSDGTPTPGCGSNYFFVRTWSATA